MHAYTPLKTPAKRRPPSPLGPGGADSPRASGTPRRKSPTLPLLPEYAHVPESPSHRASITYRVKLLERVLLVLGLIVVLKGLAVVQNHRGQVEIVFSTWMSPFDSQGRAADAPAAGSGASQPDCRSRGPHRQKFSAKELALQEGRLQSWRNGTTADGVAICLAVKDQHTDLPEWVDWHLSIGVSHIYVYDTGSKPPVDDVLQPYIKAGKVTFTYVTNFTAAAQDLMRTNDHRYTPVFKQWIVYSMCLRDYGARYRFQAYIDSDEFLVITDDSPDLPTILRDYGHHGGLVVNWRLFGSSGHKVHQNSTLLSYTKCYPEKVTEPEQLETKTILNTGYAVQPASPHQAFYHGGCHAVSTTGEIVDSVQTKRFSTHRLVLHHYVTKSLQDFKQKVKRGGAAGPKGRDMAYWNHVQKRATASCTQAADAWRKELEQRAAWQVAPPIEDEVEVLKPVEEGAESVVLL